MQQGGSNVADLGRAAGKGCRVRRTLSVGMPAPFQVQSRLISRRTTLIQRLAVRRDGCTRRCVVRREAVFEAGAAEDHPFARRSEQRVSDATCRQWRDARRGSASDRSGLYAGRRVLRGSGSSRRNIEPGRGPDRRAQEQRLGAGAGVGFDRDGLRARLVRRSREIFAPSVLNSKRTSRAVGATSGPVAAGRPLWRRVDGLELSDVDDPVDHQRRRRGGGEGALGHVELPPAAGRISVSNAGGRTITRIEVKGVGIGRPDPACRRRRRHSLLDREQPGDGVRGAGVDGRRIVQERPREGDEQLIGRRVEDSIRGFFGGTWRRNGSFAVGRSPGVNGDSVAAARRRWRRLGARGTHRSRRSGAGPHPRQRERTVTGSGWRRRG